MHFRLYSLNYSKHPTKYGVNYGKVFFSLIEDIFKGSTPNGQCYKKCSKSVFV